MKYLIHTLIFLLGYTTCSAQQLMTATEINQRVEEFLILKGPNIPDTRRLKDSVDLYSFAIEISIIKKNKSAVVNKISVNDSIAYILYKDFDFLKSIDFKGILGDKKQGTVIIPVGIIIAYVNHPVSTIPLIKAESLMNKIEKMFNYNYKDKVKTTDSFIYLKPVICLTGTKFYD